uniref:Gustatory receptor n=1 Tax=Anopheles maculatus TaxID=74869 RepID=A0A182SQQ8_9DIPT
MQWASKWWKANAFLVALMLRVLFGAQAVIFADRTSSNHSHGTARSAVARWRRISNFATASEGAARGLFTSMVVLLSSCVGFGTYWHWSDEMALTNGIIASSNWHCPGCTKSKRALRMDVIGGFALPLLVTVCIYLYRWNNRATIRDLNRNFKTIRDSQQMRQNHRWQGCFWERYGRLATKQMFEVMALGVLWLNLRPFSHMKPDIDAGDHHVGKLISSMASMLPASVCLLVSIEMGINFSLLARGLSTLNVSLHSFVRSIPAGGAGGDVIRRVNQSASCKAATRSYLRNLVMQFDEQGQFAVETVQFYAPILLAIVGMHFVLFTMQLFLCYRQMSRTTSDSMNINQLGPTLLAMLSAIASAGQIIFLVDIAADFNGKLDDDTVPILGRLSAIAHHKERNKTLMYDNKELDKC